MEFDGKYRNNRRLASLYYDKEVQWWANKEFVRMSAMKVAEASKDILRYYQSHEDLNEFSVPGIGERLKQSLVRIIKDETRESD